MARNKAKRRHATSTSTSTKTSTNPFSTPTPAPPPPAESLQDLLTTATDLLRTECSPPAALRTITRALALSPTSLPAIELAGEIHVELGEIPTAREYFLQAASIDPEGKHESEGGSGPEKFLWLGQLSEEGGREAVGWFERGVGVLRGWIGRVESSGVGREMLEERGLKGKLCSALCGMVEIYMTDLCLEPEAETNCEKFVTEALLADPDSAEALQTLASVRISQERMNDAKAALERSVALWKDLEPGSPTVPPYATRMATTRLLMETEMYDTAFEVLEGLQEEDDQVVDLWYLGGWCLYCKGDQLREEEAAAAAANLTGKGKGKGKEVSKDDDDNDEEKDDDWQTLWEASREWLNNCAQLYQAMEWEDDRLRDHAVELLGNITEVLGEEVESDGGDDDDDNSDGEEEGGVGQMGGEGEEWEDADSDEEMKDS